MKSDLELAAMGVNIAVAQMSSISDDEELAAYVERQLVVMYPIAPSRAREVGRLVYGFLGMLRAGR